MLARLRGGRDTGEQARVRPLWADIPFYDLFRANAGNVWDFTGGSPDTQTVRDVFYTGIHDLLMGKTTPEECAAFWTSAATPPSTKAGPKANPAVGSAPVKLATMVTAIVGLIRELLRKRKEPPSRVAPKATQPRNTSQFVERYPALIAFVLHYGTLDYPRSELHRHSGSKRGEDCQVSKVTGGAGLRRQRLPYVIGRNC